MKPNHDAHPLLIQAISLWAAVFIAFLCMLFGANTVAIKYSLHGLGPFSAAAIRFGLASLIIFGWARLMHQPIAIQKGQLHKLFIIGGIFFVQLSLFYVGINNTYASRGALLANMQPFYVLFLAHFFIPGDQISRQKFIGILVVNAKTRKGLPIVYPGRNV